MNYLCMAVQRKATKMDICPESGEPWERFLKKLRKLMMEARKNFRASREA